MDLTLWRKEFLDDGIFGHITDKSGNIIFCTLEHSYQKQPKLSPGSYTCVRGTHELHDLKPFETFEVTGVPNHTGILFHVGNYNNDSEGCILLGGSYGNRQDGGKMLTFSRQAFERFMALQNGIDSFILKVETN